MAKNREQNSEIATLLAVVIFGIFFLIKLLFEGLVILGKAVVWIIAKIIEKVKSKKKVDNVIKKPVEDTFFVNNKVLEKDITTRFDLKDFSKYDLLFEDKIIPRGIAYYVDDKITNVKQIENRVNCIANGTEQYNIEIVYESFGFNATCTCPYYKKDNKYCKHIYATLLQDQYGNKLKDLVSEIKENIGVLNIVLSNTEEYINNHRFLDVYKNQFYSLKNNTQQRMGLFKRTIEYPKNQNAIVKILKQELELKEYLQNEIKNILDNELKETATSSTNVSRSNYVVSKKDKDENVRYSEEELDSWGLTEEEKEIVRTTEYDPWDFEEDDMDEDSYYYEDDIDDDN